jgi:hypothetical protein
MTFNEFNIRLQKCHLDPDTKFILTHMFEVQIEYSKQLDLSAKMIEQLAQAVVGFVQLNEVMQNDLKRLIRGGRPDGVEVHSVANEPEN